MNLPDLPSRDVWHALNNALPRHPLLWFAWGGKDDLLPELSAASEVIPSALMLAGSAVTLVGWLAYGISPLILVFMLHGYIGMTAARSVASAITLARRRGVYDLMGVTPSGELAAAWAVATRYFRRDTILTGFHAAAVYLRLIWVMGLIPFIGLMLFSMCQGTGVTPTALQEVFNHPLTAFNAAVVLGVMLLDYTQALSAAGVIGMIAPTLPPSRYEARVAAPFLFLTYQIMLTAFILILHTMLMIAMGDVIVVWLRPWVSTVVWMGLFLVIREASLLGLCLVFARRMRATLHEVLTIHRRSL